MKILMYLDLALNIVITFAIIKISISFNYIFIRIINI